MKITLLCSDLTHPVVGYLNEWIKVNSNTHKISFVHRKADLVGGDILFLISCSEIIEPRDRDLFKACLVLHASDLPSGRGWSPYVWEIVSGAVSITVSLIEAEDKVDTGRIWKKITKPVPKHALWQEINTILFDAELELIDFAVNSFDQVSPQEQSKIVEPTYHRRRNPSDSEINPEKSIAEQFDLIRVCDPERYPAYFKMHGHCFKLTLEKIDE